MPCIDFVLPKKLEDKKYAIILFYNFLVRF